MSLTLAGGSSRSAPRGRTNRRTLQHQTTWRAAQRETTSPIIHQCSRNIYLTDPLNSQNIVRRRWIPPGSRGAYARWVGWLPTRACEHASSGNEYMYISRYFASPADNAYKRTAFLLAVVIQSCKLSTTPLSTPPPKSPTFGLRSSSHARERLCFSAPSTIGTTSFPSSESSSAKRSRLSMARTSASRLRMMTFARSRPTRWA